MCGAVVDGQLRVALPEEAELQAGGERVAAATLGLCAIPPRAASPERPRLAVVISIDQFQTDQQDRAGPREGRSELPAELAGLNDLTGGKGENRVFAFLRPF